MIGLSMLGCDPDRTQPCAQLYDQLVEIANRRPDVGLKKDFVRLCVETWDPQRSACLERAKTPKEAVKCRPKSVKPG